MYIKTEAYKRNDLFVLIEGFGFDEVSLFGYYLNRNLLLHWKLEISLLVLLLLVTLRQFFRPSLFLSFYVLIIFIRQTYCQ